MSFAAPSGALSTSGGIDCDCAGVLFGLGIIADVVISDEYSATGVFQQVGGRCDLIAFTCKLTSCRTFRVFLTSSTTRSISGWSVFDSCGGESVWVTFSMSATDFGGLLGTLEEGSGKSGN